MSLVVDASLALAWHFEDEGTPETEALLERVAEEGAVAPTLWRLEIANALQTALRRKRLTAAQRNAILAALARLPVTSDPDTDAHAWGATLDLAERFSLTLYDAAYLELAQRRNLALATLDRGLKAAATALGIRTA